jgi:hypothetical protein
MKSSHFLRASVFAVLLALCLLPATAHAATTVTVGCGGISGIYDYTTMQAALDAILSLPGSSFTIVVAGNCSESLSIVDRRSITIVGLSGASVSGPDDNDAFDITRSQGITIENLDISSTGPHASGLFINQGSEVKIDGCNINNNQSTGVFVARNSVLVLQNSTIENNVPGDGLDVVINSTADVIGTTIQNNGSAGTGPTSGEGVFTSDSFVHFRGSLIQNNADHGIGAVGSSLNFNGPNSTIQGHNVNGISLKFGGHLGINGPVLIQGNGKGCPADTALLVSVSQACGGISVADSTAAMRFVTISGNYGAGISVQEGAHLSLIGATVANNFGDGVHIQWISIGNFGSANSITGNGGASVFCDSRSLVIGNLEGLTNVKCVQNSQ